MPDTKPETKAEPTTDPGTPKAKVNHGQVDPKADPLFKTVYQLVMTNPLEPAKVLSWLKEQSSDVVRHAILRSQTPPFSVAAEPLVDSLTDEQACGMLVAVVVGLYQGRMSVAR